MNDKQVINNLEFQISARNSHIKELEDKIAILKSKLVERNKQIKDLFTKIEQLEQRNIELIRQIEWVKTFSKANDREITSSKKTKTKQPKTYAQMMKEQGRW